VRFTTRETRALGPDGEWVYTTVFLVEGKEVAQDEYERLWLEHQPLVREVHEIIPRKGRKRAYPYASQAMAVHPDQIARAIEIDKKRGAPATDYTKTGEPILTSRGHRRQFLKAHRMHDRNSYTGH
jgi:hypothetical protein